MVSDKEIQAAIKAIEAVPIMGDTYSLSGEDAKAAARAALEAAARVRAEAAEGGEVVASIPLGKGNVIDGGGANISQPLYNKHITIRDREAPAAPTADEPMLDLLREARWFVEVYDNRESNSEVDSLLSRIDAILRAAPTAGGEDA